MKKTGEKKKILIMGLAAMMAASVCIQANASSAPATDASLVTVTEGSTAEVIVGVGTLGEETTANGGDTIYAYQVVDINYDSESNTVEYAFTDAFQAFQTSDLGDEWSTLTPETYSEMSEEAIKPLLGAFSAYVKDDSNGVDESYQALADGNGIATFSSMDMGQYIILGGGSSTAAKIYQIVTAEVEPEAVDGAYQLYDAYQVGMKTSTPNIEKEITTGTVDDTIEENVEDTANIGDLVTYDITVTVPTYPSGATNKTFYIGDALSVGLELVSEAGDFVVKGYLSEEDTEGSDLTEEAYKVAIDGQTFFVDFNFDDIVSYQRITISYEAKLTEDAIVGTKEGNKNDVELVYSNSPYDGSTWEPSEDPDAERPSGAGYGEDVDEEILYTYAFAIDKYDAQNYQTKLSSAEFSLTSEEGDVNVLKEQDGIYYVSNDASATPKVVTDVNGQVIIVGLRKGTYTLTETKAPSGFNLLSDTIEVNIDASSTVYAKNIISTTTKTTYEYTSDVDEAMDDNGSPARAKDQAGRELYFENDGSGAGMTTTLTAYPVYIKSQNEVQVSDTEVEMTIIGPDTVNSENGYYLVAVANSKGIQLPSTGGIGTTLFYVVGSLLVMVSLGALIYRRCKRKE